MRAAVIAAFFLLGCRGGTTFNTGDSRLRLSGGLWLFQDKPFTGSIVENLPDATRVTEYLNGAEHGLQTTTLHAGNRMDERSYAGGKKHGIHRGWFADGKDRFYTEFANDHYSGEHWTWHSNGKVAEYKKYTPDGQILVHKHWRESGQIYRNQVFALNAESGFPGVKLCNTVKETVGSR